MTTKEMIEKLEAVVSCHADNGLDCSCDYHDATAALAVDMLAALRSRPAPTDDLALRHAWEAGFRLCRSYGDNHHHFDGEQKERRWRDYANGLVAPATVAAPALKTPRTTYAYIEHACGCVYDAQRCRAVPPHRFTVAAPAPETPAPDAMPGEVPPSSTWGDLGRAAKCSRCNDDGRPCSHCEAQP